MRLMIVVALALTACTALQPKPPSQFSSCAPRVATPATPKEPRTLASIAQWANDLHDALSKANAARDDCANKLNGLNAWLTTTR